MSIIITMVALFSYTACDNVPVPPGFVGTWVNEETYYGSSAIVTLILTENSLQLTFSIAGDGEYGYYKILFYGVRANIEVSEDTMNLTITEFYSFDKQEWIDNADPDWNYYMYYYYYYYYGYTDTISWTFNIEGDILTLFNEYSSIEFIRQ